MDFHVPLANIAEERFSWRADFSRQEDAVERPGSFHIRFRLHQPPRGQPQAKDDDFLHRYVPGELLACVAVDGRHLAGQNRRLVYGSILCIRLFLRWNRHYGGLLQVRFVFTI